MASGWKAAAAFLREQRGLTLIELLVASTLGLLVVGAGLSIFLSAMRSEPRTGSKVAAIQQGRFTVDRIVRELRQGREIAESPAPSSSQLAIVTYVKATGCTGSSASTATLCKVSYACSSGACTRTVAQADGSAPGTPVQVVSGLSSSAIFTYSPTLPQDPTYVGVTLSFAGDSDPVVLGDGAALRNPEEEA